MAGSKDKHLSDLLAILQETRKEAASPGDAIAGIAVRQFLQVISPSLLHNLDNLGIGPGRFINDWKGG